jgi:hypothetical protein
MFFPKWKILRARKAKDSGQTLVESAICFAVFFVLIFGVIEFGFLFYTKVTMQNAVRQAARYAITGNCNVPGQCFVIGGTGNRYATIVQTVENYSFAIPLSSSNITVVCIQGTCPGYSGGTGGSGNAGGPEDTIKITATYTFTPIFIGKFFSGGNYPITVSATFKNEPFPPPAS